MPRYKLRTLLILLAIVAMIFARVGYLNRMAAWHRHKAAEHLPLIAAAEGVTVRDAAQSIKHLTTSSSGVRTIVFEEPFQQMAVLEGMTGNGLVVQNKAALSHWDDAIKHSILAARFERATYRPWTIVIENPSK